MRGRRARPLGGLFRLALGLALGARPVSAESPRRGVPDRVELLARAERERAAGHDAAALAAALAASKLGVTSSLLRFIAEEHAALREFGAAFEAARGCTEAAANEPPSGNHDVVFLGCRALMHELGPHVALLTFAWRDQLPDNAVLVLDGEVIEPERRARGVEPGKHSLHFDAVGYEPLALELTLNAGDTRRVNLTLAPTAAPSPATHGATPPLRGEPAAMTPNSAVQPSPARRPHAANTRRPASLTVPIVVTGGGAALLSAALATSLDSSAKYTDLRRTCGRVSCGSAPPERHAIDSLDTGSTVLLLAGAAAVATGAVWLTFSLSARRHARSARVGVGPGFCSVAGAF